MKTLTASIQIFANRRSHEDDAARAENAVNAYLGTLSADAALCYGAHMLDMMGEDHDVDAAGRWRAVDNECMRVARAAGLAGWVRAEDADIQIEYRA